MGDDVEDVARAWVDDRQPVDLVLDEAADGVEQALVGADGDEQLGLAAQLVPPGFESVLLQLLDLPAGVEVVLLQDADEVCDGQHANKVLALGVPQWGGTHAVVDQGEEGLFDQELQEEIIEQRTKHIQ